MNNWQRCSHARPEATPPRTRLAVERVADDARICGGQAQLAAHLRHSTVDVASASCDSTATGHATAANSSCSAAWALPVCLPPSPARRGGRATRHRCTRCPTGRRPTLPGGRWRHPARPPAAPPLQHAAAGGRGCSEHARWLSKPLCSMFDGPSAPGGASHFTPTVVEGPQWGETVPQPLLVQSCAAAGGAALFKACHGMF